LKRANISISPAYDGALPPVTLRDEHGDVAFYLLPFIKPAHVRRCFPDEKIETYTDACRVAISHLSLDDTCRNVLLTHQFVTGAQSCDSEEVSVGGSDNVDASVFDGFDYVALGHIHGAQNIGSNRIRYCGTPLKYSFSEEKHHKSVTVVNLGKKGELQLTLRPLTPLHDLRTLRGSFAEVTDKAFYEAEVCDDYLHVVLTDEEDIPDVMGRLRVIYPNIMKLDYDNKRTKNNHSAEMAEGVEKKSPLTLFSEFYEQQNGQPMSDKQTEFIQNLIEEIWEDEK
jgi:exonuclease SbcD